MNRSYLPFAMHAVNSMEIFSNRKVNYCPAITFGYTFLYTCDSVHANWRTHLVHTPASWGWEIPCIHLLWWQIQLKNIMCIKGSKLISKATFIWMISNYCIPYLLSVVQHYPSYLTQTSWKLYSSIVGVNPMTESCF